MRSENISSSLEDTNICTNNICKQKDAEHYKLVAELVKKTEEFRRDHSKLAESEIVADFLSALETLLEPSKSGLKDQEEDTENDIMEDYFLDPSSSSSSSILCSGGDTTAIESCITNPLIIQLILERLLPRDILVFRLVSKTWCAEGTKILETMETKFGAEPFQVSFTWSSTKGEYENFRMGTLEDFTDFLDLCCDPENAPQNSSADIGSLKNYFPTKCFRFDGGGNLDSPRSRAFFKKYGATLVHHLVLDLKPKPGVEASEKTTMSTLRALILEMTPKLRVLNWVNTPWATDNEEERLFQDGLEKQQIPALQVLSIDFASQVPRNFVLDLLTAAPNLKVTRDRTVRFLPQLITAEKTGTVKHLSWTFHVDALDRMLNFAATRPKLTFLGLALDLRNNPGHWPAVTNFVNQILDSSADTLEKWSYLPCLDFLQGLVIPVMTKLHHVYINVEIKHADHAIFPPTLTNVSSRFPAVRELELSDPNKRFSTTSSVSKKAAGWVKIVHEAFPNLTHLTFEVVTMSELPDFCRAVWKVFPGLKWLQIFINYETTTMTPRLTSDMDSAITGLSIETCKNLRAAIRQGSFVKKGIADEKKIPPDFLAIPPTRAAAKLLRQGPSICDLKDLKEFRLYWVNYTSTYYSDPFLSPVSKLYGFDLMARSDFQVKYLHGFFLRRVVENMDQSLQFSVYG